MKMSFELTENDVLEFNKFHSWYSPDRKNYRIKNKLYTAAFLGIIPVVVMADKGFAPPRLLAASLAGLFGFAFGFFATRPYILAFVERRVAKFFNEGKNQDMIEFRTMEFKDGVIQCNSKTSETKVELSSIEK